MKSKEVLGLLRVSRVTLSSYVKNGSIKAIKLPNGQYEYDDVSVYSFFNRGTPQKTVLYARVSTSKQKKDLENQTELLKWFALEQGWVVSRVFSDVASGIDFEKRKEFFEMLDMIVSGKVERVVISYRDRLSRIGFNLFVYLFRKYNCEIVVVSEVGSEKLDSEEIFEEIISMLHCYSIKHFSGRRCKSKAAKIKEVLEDGFEDFDDKGSGKRKSS